MEKIIKTRLYRLVLLGMILISTCPANESRGSIITADNQVVAMTSSDEQRVYPLSESLSPILGYVNSKLRGQKGLEKSADEYLSMGYNVKLNINLKLQEEVESILDTTKRETNADEVMAAVMDSETGKVLTMATSNRYDPARITKKDIAALCPKVTEYPYEPGSVLMPLTLAIALEHNTVTPDTWIDTFGGRMEINGGRFITDNKKLDGMTAAEIILHSSNIGISQIAWTLTGEEFSEGLVNFGIGLPSGIDLSRDLSGTLKTSYKVEQQIQMANTSYGYGMMATFAQLFKAYSAFNNDGIVVTPRLIDYVQNAEGNYHELGAKIENSQAISKETATIIHDILLDFARQDTAVNPHYTDLKIGGKMGTAYIVKNGRYIKEFHNGFYGFLNDCNGNKYTIGILLIRTKNENSHFTVQSVGSMFEKVVNKLINEEYLFNKKK